MGYTKCGYNLIVSTPVLATKLFIPAARPNLVRRSRLTARLAQGLNGKLTLVSAPAGFGKTTLLCECIYSCERPAAWISLDDGDNNQVRFLSYLISAFQKIKDGIGDGLIGALLSSESVDTETLLSGLINQIAEIQYPFVIVLDDYHVITEKRIHEILIFILENQLPKMHLIISTRADPPWPLARWRARGDITEIRTQDLRFTPEETSVFLNSVMHLGLSAEDILRLGTRTEGWVAGLKMAALSIQGCSDVSGFIRSFSGSHRFIFDYLIEEVLQKLPPKIQEFLLKTSILERMCASLCNTVTGYNDSQHTLEQLDQMNLFVVPLDDQRHWYRYHHLFADLLRSRLHQSWSDDVPETPPSGELMV